MKIRRIAYFMLASLAIASISRAQEDMHRIYGTTFPDSVLTSAHASFDRYGKFHHLLFGENYRKEWAVKVKLPVIRISAIAGGLKPQQLGGGMQTKSLRLLDATGKEWVIRSVEKVPDKLLPENLRGTFVLDWIDDEYSEQHPYAPLCVAPLADAVGVPHTNPVIGVLEADKAMGSFSKDYAGHVMLIEEREPTGESATTLKMMKALVADHDNRIDKEEFLKARMLDLMMGDWDRHEDQWRWTKKREGKENIFTGVPRDRDQVFHTRQGIFPSIAALEWLDPTLDKFDGAIPRVKYSLFKTRFIQQIASAQINYTEWMSLARQFVAEETDQVLANAIDRLPQEVRAIRRNELLTKLKQRRDNLPAAMDRYYHFIYRIVDIRTSDKNERVVIQDAPGGGLHVIIDKMSKNETKNGSMLDMMYDPDITAELRIYLGDGNDQVDFQSINSKIKTRIIGNAGEKIYTAAEGVKRIQLYSRKDSIQFSGNSKRFRTHLSNDTLNTHFVATDPYNIWMPLATGGLNIDDGFLLGLGFRYTGHDGFRKLPYSTIQEVMVTHSFKTDAFRIRYSGQWREALGRADILLNAAADAPANTVNFFGQGNESVLNKSGDYHRYYRARFDLYKIEPGLRWSTAKNSTISAGPSFQFYHFDPADNRDRAVTQPGIIKSYDSLLYQQNKAHLGLFVHFIADTKDRQILPTKGHYFDVNLTAYGGVNNSSRSFAQLRPEFTFYQKIDANANLVLMDRIGGGISVGNPAFYQSLFLGGQGNLEGYLKNRFSGQHMVFNNLQGRFRIADLGGYILPGQLGITGFYDIGRVWIKNDHSNRWHQGTGGGLYFAPATLTVVELTAAHSGEGWYPFIAFNFRL